MIYIYILSQIGQDSCLQDMKDSEDESKFMKKLLSMIQSALAANAEVLWGNRLLCRQNMG